MIRIAGDKWIADLGRMRCKNYIDDITVDFVHEGKALYGEVSDMPVNIIIAGHLSPDENNFFQRIIDEAEDVFLRAYYERDLEDTEKPCQWR